MTPMLRAPPSPDSIVTVRFRDRQLERDNLYVQFKLGLMLFKGEMYVPNTVLGFRFMAGLAERRYGPACWTLAAHLYRGAYGLPANKEVALYYWRKGNPPRKLERSLRRQPATVIPFERRGR